MKINGHSCGSIFTDKNQLGRRFLVPASLLRSTPIRFWWPLSRRAFRVDENPLFPRTARARPNKGICDRFLPHFPVSQGHAEKMWRARQQRLFRQPCFSHIARRVLPVDGFDVMKNYSRVLVECFSKNSEIFPGSFVLALSTHTSVRTPRKGGRQFNILF